MRLPLTVLGAFFAGFTGFMTFGGTYAADDVFGFVDGTQVIDEHVLEGREPFCIGSFDCPTTRRAAWRPSGMPRPIVRSRRCRSGWPARAWRR